MRTLFVLLAAIAAFSVVLGESYEGYKIYEATPKDDAQMHLLKKFDGLLGYDFLMLSRLAGHPAHILVDPLQEATFIAFLKAESIPFSVLVADVKTAVQEERQQNEAARARASTGVASDRYLRYDEILDFVDSLKAAHPDLVTVTDAGLSSQGRKIKTVRISSSGDGSKPAIAMDAGIHAREWIAPAVVLHIMQQLVQPENRDLLANADWLFLPVTNPDGYEYTHTDSRFWRKTRSVNAGSTCVGTDGNRNFDYYWMYDGASSNPCSDTYGGSKAHSEPEVQILANFLNSTKNIKLYLAVHSYGEYILYPWGYANVLPVDWKDLHALAAAGAKAISDSTGTRYTVGSSTQVLYAAAGASDDYAKGVAGVKYSYTLELPGNGFDLPPSQISRVNAETFLAIRVFGEHINANF